MGEYSEKPLHDLVFNDKFYREVQARLKDPNERDQRGRTLLHLAAWSPEDNPRILKWLLGRGADVNSVAFHGYTPLHYAVCAKKRHTVAALIDAGASVNSKDSLGRTALHFAITGRWPCYPSPILVVGCDMWIVEKLLSHPEIKINPVDKLGETPLQWAVREQNFDTVGILLKKGANPNIAKRDKRIPLHVALLALNPCYDIVTSLLANGSGLYCADKFRQTPIDLLIHNIPNDEALQFASRCVELIAFRYQIRESLKRKLKIIPLLSETLDECCIEVSLMKRVIVHGKFTLYDFALDCFQWRVENPVQTIYTPLVEILLTGLFSKYFHYIFCRISGPDLHRVLVRTVGRITAENLVPNDASSNKIYDAIRICYDENDVLKQRVLKFKEFIIKKVKFNVLFLPK